MAPTVLSATNKALTLTQRKHVRDNMEHHDKHIKRIEAATGVSGWEYDFEGDIAAFSAALPEDRRENFAGVLLAAYLDNVAEMFERGLKDPMVKQGFLAALPTKKIFFKPLDKKPDGRHQEVKVENGALYIGCEPKSSWWTNINDISNQMVEKLSFANTSGAAYTGKQLSEENTSLSLVQRKHIRDNKVHHDKHIGRIEKATGVSGWEYDFEGDLAAFGAKLDANRQENFGGVLCAAYLDSVAEMFERVKDEMVKKELLAALPTKKIFFKPLDAKPAGRHQDVKIENGALYIGCEPKSWWTNINDISNQNVEKIIPASSNSTPYAGKQLSEDNTSLNITQRKHIRDNKVHHDKHIGRIEKATGVSGWTYDFEGDLAAFGAALEASRQDNFGGVLMASYLDNTAEMIERNMKDEMIKTEFLAAVPSKKIFFRPCTEKPYQRNQDVKIENGNLYIGCMPANWWCNMGDISNQSLEKLIPASSAPYTGKALSHENTTLSLTQRKHIRDNKVNLDKHLARIEKATGVSGWTYEFDGDLAAFAKSFADDKTREKEMVGGIISAAYLDNVASMIENNMKDEMVKEAFLDTVSGKQIVFKPLAAKEAGINQKVSIDDGKLMVGCFAPQFWTNLNDISGFKLEKCL